MTVDIEAIARRQRCELSALRIALPLLEQGYEPPFLSRYRRDELGAVPERALWEVVAALRTERQLEARREELRGKYRDGHLDDDALLASIDQAQTPRQLDRIARRIRNEAGNNQPASKLAVRLLNPKAGDPSELSALAELVVGVDNATAAVEGLVGVLGQYLAADSRMVQAASAWMDKHVQLHVIDVHDPHEGSANPPGELEEGDVVTEDTPNLAPTSAAHGDGTNAETNSVHVPAESNDSDTANDSADTELGALQTEVDSAIELSADADGIIETAHVESDDTSADVTDPDGADDAAEVIGFVVDPLEAKSSGKGKKGKGNSGKDAKPAAPEAQRKKISPRQRRRKWLVGVLEPLKGKSLPKSRLTAFQVVMLGRALRSQVARCAFKYNARHLVDFLAKTAAGLNQDASNELAQVVVDNEATIRAALEGAWWDDLIDRAARRLINVASDSLRRQMHRQPLDAKNVLVIDAVGPRTSAVVVVDSEDRVLHSEDVPCQLTKAMRQQLVTRLGELVHQHHVDLIIVSNGPARRGVMVAITELLAQSQGSPLRWTLAERAGAEVYAGGPEGNRELRSLPRRFRAAVWLAQLVRSPARALAKVEVSKLRLGSYQRELAERSLAGALRDVVTSGVCQISVDANGADRGWLSSLPGVSDAVAEAIDKRRRDSLFDSRATLLALNNWPDAVAQRQAIPFLRVFGGNQPLDATPIHPDDYCLAEKLMARLEIPAPPAAPPGYEPPDYHIEPPKAEVATPEPTATGFVEVKINPVDPDAPFGELPSDGTAETVSAEAGSAEPSSVESNLAVSADVAASGSALEAQVSEDEVVAGDGILDSTVSSDMAPRLEGVSSEADQAADGATADRAAEPKPVYEPYRVELPAAEKLARCAKEWQVGEHRVQQIVRALCDPFGMQQVELSGPVAAMPTVPKLTELKPGDLVAGVVVGIAGFGVFVELGPECSGLIHVSRVSEDFVEDLNEFLQIGDVINAWVVEIDSKRRRVSLSGISPERQEAVRQQKREWSESAKATDRPNRSNRDNRGGRGQGTSEAPRPTASRGNAEGGTGERRVERAQDRNQARGNREGRGEGARPSGRPQADAATGRGKNLPGARRDNRDSNSRGTKSYTAVSRTNAPVAKLTEGMKSGSEPLRSFGDLMQFFKDARQGNDSATDTTTTVPNTAPDVTSQPQREDRDTVAAVPPVDQSPSDGNADSSVPPADPTA